MFKSLLLFLAAAAAVKATGEFVVLHSPDSVRFHGNEEVELSLLKEIYAAALGFTVKLRGVWSGISIMDPFNLPGALVTVVVEGIDSLETPNKERFPLIIDEDEETAWQAVRRRCEKTGNNNTFVRFSFEDGIIALGQSALGELKPMPIDTLPLKELDLNREEDTKFLEEVQLMRAIAKNVLTVIKSDSRPDIYWLVFSGIGPISQTHGKNSSVTKEALSLLSAALNAISEAFIDAYEGKVLITAFTNDATQVRHTRSVILERNARDASNLDSKSRTLTSTSEAKRVLNNTDFNNYNFANKQDDREGENKKVEDEEDTNTVISSTSESENDIESTPAYSGNSEENEKSDQDLTDTEHKINTNTQKIGQEDLKDVPDTVAAEYDENYPVIFNIVLWFGVVFCFSLLAICIAIADMDPGRDSIIFRMTSNRMKKDN